MSLWMLNDVKKVQKTADNVQAQLNQAIADGDQLAETQQARVDEVGVPHTTLKERIDSSVIELKQKYNENASRLSKISKNALSYGQIKMPNWFLPELPCDFYRDFDGLVKHNMNFSRYKNGTTIYVDNLNGNNSTGDGSDSAPYKTISKAVDAAIAGVDDAYCVRVKSTGVPFYRDEGWNNGSKTIVDKTIAIIPDNPDDRITITTGQKGLTYTQDGVGTWKADRSSVLGVYDLTYKDVYGTYIPYEHKSTLSECQEQKGSWYTDGTSVWVHTLDGAMPTDDRIIVGVNIAVLGVNLQGSATLYLENIDYVQSKTGNGSNIFGSGANESFVAVNCKFIGGNVMNSPTSESNAFYAQDLKNCFLFNCIAAYAKRDGFNHSYPNVPAENRKDCLALLYNCISYDNGLTSNQNNNNAFTSHEGASVVRIGCIGYNTHGPVMVDVNGCDSVIIDCHMRDSYNSVSAAYQFGWTSDDGNVYIENCDGGGTVTYDLESYLPTTIKGFRGSRVKANLATFIE